MIHGQRSSLPSFGLCRSRRAVGVSSSRPKGVISTEPVSRRASSQVRQAASRGLDPSSVRLTWPGRRWREGDAPPTSATTEKLQTVEIVGDAAAPHRLVYGDGLDVLGALEAEGLDEKVDLVYVDPPYASD